MNARLLPSVAALALLTACAPAERPDAEAAPPPVAVDVANVGLAVPEAVMHDPAADVYLVSNINGLPADRDDNGFISRLNPSGEVATLKWIDGAAQEVTLHAPKGMALRNDTLFVADIDERASSQPGTQWQSLSPMP